MHRNIYRLSMRLGLLGLACLVAFQGSHANAQKDLLPGLNLQPGGDFQQPKDMITATAAITLAERGQPAMLHVTADIEPTWHTYSITQAPGGPIRTKIKLDPSDDYKLVGEFTPTPEPKKHVGPEYPGLELQEHEGTVTWSAPIEIRAGVDPAGLRIKGSVWAQVCSNACLAPKDYFFEGQVEETSDRSADADLSENDADESAAGQKLFPETDLSVAADGTYRTATLHAVVRGYLEPSQVVAGGKVKLVLMAEPLEGYHVYALARDKPSKLAKPTLIKLLETSGLTAGMPVPSADPIRHKSETGDASFYHVAPIAWTIELQVPKAAEGKLEIAGVLGIQTCDDRSCDPPAGVRFHATLTVGEKTGPGQIPLVFSAAKYVDAVNGDTAAPSPSKSGSFDESAIVINDQGSTSLAGAMFFGFLGGLILNLMPCVLPVIGLKVMSFVDQAGQNRHQVLVLNIWYSLGIVTIFVGLGMLAHLAGYQWGALFGEQSFSVGLAVLVFAMALSLIGVWEIPIPGFIGSGKSQELASREGEAGAYAKGVVTTLLATPCAGPFLGSALGWAIGKPPAMIYAVFVSAGLGMSAPYLLIGVFPQLIRVLPKPGAWMETFKHLMGFMLLGTVVYILTFMETSFVVPTVAMLIGAWAGCWWIGRIPFTATRAQRAVGWIGACLFMLLIGEMSFGLLRPVMAARLETRITQEIVKRNQNAGKKQPAVVGGHHLNWQPYSPQALREFANERKTVMIDFTADWCPNCKTLEATVLNTKAVKDLVEANGVVTLVADYTSTPDEITSLMRELQAGAVPVLAIFPAGDPSHPIVYRDGYTQSTLLDALRQAGPSREMSASRSTVRQ